MRLSRGLVDENLRWRLDGCTFMCKVNIRLFPLLLTLFSSPSIHVFISFTSAFFQSQDLGHLLQLFSPSDLLCLSAFFFTSFINSPSLIVSPSHSHRLSISTEISTTLYPAGLPKPPVITTIPNGGESTSYTLTLETESYYPLTEFIIKYRKTHSRPWHVSIIRSMETVT